MIANQNEIGKDCEKEPTQSVDGGVWDEETNIVLQQLETEASTTETSDDEFDSTLVESNEEKKENAPKIKIKSPNKRKKTRGKASNQQEGIKKYLDGKRKASTSPNTATQQSAKVQRSSISADYKDDKDSDVT